MEKSYRINLTVPGEMKDQIYKLIPWGYMKAVVSGLLRAWIRLAECGPEIAIMAAKEDRLDFVIRKEVKRDVKD